MVRKGKNLKKIQEIYNWSDIVEAYERLMVKAAQAKSGGMASLCRQIV
jgi:hypothetical protein